MPRYEVFTTVCLYLVLVKGKSQVYAIKNSFFEEKVKKKSLRSLTDHLRSSDIDEAEKSNFYPTSLKAQAANSSESSNSERENPECKFFLVQSCTDRDMPVFWEPHGNHH